MMLFATAMIGSAILAGSAAATGNAVPVAPIETVEQRDLQQGIGYLEGLRGTASYLAPSQIDPRYNVVLYVNTATGGPTYQRMWVLQRDHDGGPLQLGMWDQDYWTAQGVPEGEVPPYSWLISSGKVWPGERSGPTPVGVFNLDERGGRLKRGWRNPRIRHIAFIDLHYSSGRRSGIAFHGTPEKEYERLGQIASHGCIRMKQDIALAVLNRVTGKDGVLSRARVWGKVPRFWRSQRRGIRRGYVRNGIPFAAPLRRSRASKRRKRRRQNVIAARLGDPFSAVGGAMPVLTKTGYRTLVVFFKDEGEPPPSLSAKQAKSAAQ